MTNIEANTMTLNGVRYVREDAIPAAQPNGNRAVVVVDRGWIFAGDVTENDGKITLERAVWVFRWESIGFAGVLAEPKSSKVSLKPMPTPVEIPAGSEIFRCPVSDHWGLE